MGLPLLQCLYFSAIALYGPPAIFNKEVQRWFHWYNQERPHQALKYRTPELVYWETISWSVTERELLSKEA